MKTGEINNFESLLEDAESNAKTAWEIDFVSDIIERYDEYEDNTFLSDNQLAVLERIANAR
jgi:hypothetical protein